MIPSGGAKISNTRHHGQKKFFKLKKKKGTFIRNSDRNSQALGLLSQMGNPGLGQLSKRLTPHLPKPPQGQGPLSSALCPTVPGRV